MRPRWGGWLGLLNPNGWSIAYIGHEQNKIGFTQPFVDADFVGGKRHSPQVASSHSYETERRTSSSLFIQGNDWERNHW